LDDILEAGKKAGNVNDRNGIDHGAMTGFSITMQKRKRGRDIAIIMLE